MSRFDGPVVLALDEIHALNNELQSSLLTLLNSRVYVSPPDKKTGRVERIPIKEFTFIGATTDDDKILDTIKNRCLRLTFQLVDYTPEELRRIYKNKIASLGLTVDEDALDTCIPRSRGAIRYVNSIVEGLDKALYNDNGERVSTHITLAVALGYFAEKGIDSIGLSDKDLEILHVLDDYTGDAMGVDVLAARVGLDTRKYLSEYERYLIKIGFINVSGKGRALTERAIMYLRDGGTSLKPDVGTPPAAPQVSGQPAMPEDGAGEQPAMPEVGEEPVPEVGEQPEPEVDEGPVPEDGEQPAAPETDEPVTPTDGDDGDGDGDDEDGDGDVDGDGSGDTDGETPRDIVDELFGD